MGSGAAAGGMFRSSPRASPRPAPVGGGGGGGGGGVYRPGLATSTRRLA